MKKKSSSPKKRIVRRGKQQRLKRRQRSLKQRVAQLSKTNRSWASLTAALRKAASVTSIEPEKLRQLPRLGKSPFAISLDTPVAQHRFWLRSSVIQPLLSFKGNRSAAPGLTDPSRLESIVLRAAERLLWMGSRRIGPLSPVGCQLPPLECKPLVLICSSASSSEWLALAPPNDSGSIAVAPLPEKRFHKESPSLRLSSSFLAACETASYKKVLTAFCNPFLIAENQPRAERSFSDDETDWVNEDVTLGKLHTVYESLHPASQLLEKTCGFIRKSHRCHKKSLFRIQRIPRNTKNRLCYLGQAGFFVAKNRRWLPAANGLCVNFVKWPQRKHRGCSRQRCLVKSTNYLYQLITEINADTRTHHLLPSFTTRKIPVMSHFDNTLLPESESVLNEGVPMLCLNRMVANFSQTMTVDAMTEGRNLKSRGAHLAVLTNLFECQDFPSIDTYPLV
jgi:hypothetical protein